MNIHEYQAKELLAKFGVPVPAGYAALSVEEAVEASKKLPGKTTDGSGAVTDPAGARRGLRLPSIPRRGVRPDASTVPAAGPADRVRMLSPTSIGLAEPRTRKPTRSSMPTHRELRSTRG